MDYDVSVEEEKQRTFLVTWKFQVITIDDAVYIGVYVPYLTASYSRRLGFFLRVFTNYGKKKNITHWHLF